MRIKYLLSVLIILFTITDVISQLGSTHYIPPVHSRTGISEAWIYVSTPLGAPPTRPIDVTVSRPDGTIVGVRTIMRGTPATIDVSASGLILLNQNELSLVQNNRGLIVSSTDLIYVSLRLNVNNHAGYLTAKGEDALGTRFRLGSSELINTGSTNNFFASVMATENNTQVQFTHDAGVVFENGAIPNPLFLNAGETITVSGYANGANNNTTGFIGALVESSLPVVVNSGNLNSNLPTVTFGSDMMLDQIVDESLVGFEYMLVRGRGNDVLERPMVIATVPNTIISVNGIPQATLLLPGDYAYLDPLLFQPCDWIA